MELQEKKSEDWLMLWVTWAQSWLEESDLVALVTAVAAASSV